ncbi:Gfo/Idh/MocA family protein [Lederbergia wuyishanensis]|uniref:Dehydrogenase n=1 Tax=Lederbergia wuyishanensis TaxID=1347903 RepID=A0ABU0DA02_9BACI|nr:Gfo/Idh/MocA family oxidoreductase [Lederbergia wuyishanensis]MCJ8008504.1 Gfo/Idh/MocA family oxidoreductase [Lederbergia wuyishanensis]MDQ0345247.1 putative dehydrogenase [Lederbergia wuyishanensis]
MQYVLIVGLGSMGRTHLRAYQEMNNVRIAGIVDIQEQLELNNKDISFFNSFDEAVETLERIDVIDICLPTYLHKEYVKKAAELGKHVICEKPIARTLEEAKSMIDICQKNNVRLFIGQVVRFFPEYERAKRLIEAGTIGKPGIIRTSRNGKFPKAWNDWYSNYQNSGGVVLDLLIHDFDFLRWCFGEVNRVYAKGLMGREFAKIDYALVTLRFESGTIAHVEGSWAHDKFYTAYEFAGDNGSMEFDSRRYAFTAIKKRNVEDNSITISQNPLNENPYYQELTHFIECIEKNSPPIVTAEDAIKALEISLAAKKSMQMNKPVYLKEIL